MKKDNVACFGLGIDQVPFLKKLSKDFNVIGFDKNANCAGAKYTKKRFSTSFIKKKKILKILKKNKIKKIFSFATERPIELIGFLNNQLNYSGLKTKVTDFVSDKYKLRMRLNKKILQPNFYLTISKKILKKKILIKPKKGSGSEKISFINQNKFINNKNFYFEEFIPCGKVYAIDGFCINKKFYYVSLSSKKKFSDNIFIDKIVRFNIQNKTLTAKAVKLAQEHCDILSINSAPIHFEFILSKNRIYSIDFHVRGPGSGIYSNLMNNLTKPDIYTIQKNLESNNLFKRKNNFFSLIYFINSIEELNYFNKFFNKNIIFEVKIWNIKKNLTINNESTRDRIGAIYFKFYNYNLFKINSKYIENFFKDYS